MTHGAEQTRQRAHAGPGNRDNVDAHD
jgi:hypothetical protein